MLAALDAVCRANGAGTGCTTLLPAMEADLRRAGYVITPMDCPLQTGAWITTSGDVRLATLRNQAGTFRTKGSNA